MFPRRYYPRRYFTPRYWPQSGTTPPTPPTPPPTPPATMFGGSGPIHTIYRQGNTPNEVALLMLLLADD